MSDSPTASPTALAAGPAGAPGRPRRRCPRSEGGEHSLVAGAGRNRAVGAPTHTPAGARGGGGAARTGPGSRGHGKI